MKWISRIAIVILLGYFASTVIRAGQQPANIVDPQKAWALVVGISNYEHAEPLKYAASDASSIADFLQSPRGGGFLKDHIHVLLEGDATLRNVGAKLSGPLRLSTKVKEGESVYVFLAGHGYTEDGIGKYVRAVDT